MPDDTIVNLEELAQNLPDHPERYTELGDVDISSLSFDDLETYSALLEQYAAQMDSNTVDSLRARIEERVKHLEMSDPGDEAEESTEDVVQDEPAEESTQDVVQDEPVEETPQQVAREAFNLQEILVEWQVAKVDGDEDKMEEIGQKIADVLPHISEEDIQKSSMDDVYALHDLLEDETFRDHLPMNAYLNAENVRSSLFWHRINDFERQYGLFPLQDPATVEASHKILDQISTKELIENLDVETKDLLNRLTVVRPATEAINKKIKERVEKDQPDHDIALMIERVRLETQIAVANHTAPEEDVKAAFAEEFKDRLQYNITFLVGAEKICDITHNQNRKPSPDEMNAIYKDYLNFADLLSIDQRTLAAWHAQKQADSEVALKRMDKQQGFKEIVKTLRGRLAEIDEKCHKKYGNWYSLAKTALKSAGWGAAYSVGAAFGPVGITAVATASFANNAYKQYKEFKKAKEKNQNLSFMGYLKNNKMAAASLGLGLVSAATAAVGISGDTVVKATKMAAGTSLGLAGALKASSQAFKKTKGSRYDKTKAAIKSFGSSAAGFILGMWAGHAAGSAINTDTHIPAENNLADVSDPIHDAPLEEAPVNEAPVNEASVNEVPVNDAPVDAAPVHEAPVDVAPAHEAPVDAAPAHEAPVNEAPVDVAPAIDLDNLTPQQQHDLDMLFKRAPTEAYEVLDKAGYEGNWMNSRELAAAYDSLTDAQKTALLEYAGERFDDLGHFQDVDGHPSAAQMEADAKAYSAAHSQTNAEEHTADKNQAQEHVQNQSEKQVSDQNQAPDQPLPEGDIHITQDGVEYVFDEYGININGSTKDIDVQSLYPENNGDTASKVLEAHLKTVALQDRVYMDMAARELAGEEFNPQERVFINHHEQLLDRFGLTHDENGNLVRASEMAREPEPVPVQETQAEVEKINMATIDKVRVHGNDIKITGHDAEGHRVVQHIENTEGIRDGKYKMSDLDTKNIGKTAGNDIYEAGNNRGMDPNTAREMERVRAMLNERTVTTTESPSAPTTTTKTSSTVMDRGGR